MPEISIIMPVYNTQQFLNKSIRSLLNQSFTDFELILANDGSTDHSLLYCKALAERDQRIIVLDLPHGGVAAARAAAINAAEGKYIGFVDSDDWVEKDYLMHLHTAIVENDADISVCRYTYEYGDGPKKPLDFYEAGIYKDEALEALKKAHLPFYSDRSGSNCLSLYLWDKLFKRALITDNLRYMDRTIKRQQIYCLLFPPYWIAIVSGLSMIMITIITNGNVLWCVLLIYLYSMSSQDFKPYKKICCVKRIIRGL